MSDAHPAVPSAVPSSASPVAEPAWVEHAIWWHVYPLGFVGADTSGADTSGADTSGADTTDADGRGPVVHRLGRVVGYLDHLIRLGCSGLALGPVFASSSHGYDTADYFRVDSRLGDDGDLDQLIAEAHARSIRVMLDGVFNHVGRAFVDRVGEGSALLAHASDGALESFEGHDALIALDHRNPEVVDLVVEVMLHWCERGVDAWRLDAAYSVPTGFWAEVLPRVRERFPDVYVMGEVLHGDHAAFVRDSGVDAVTQYELWKATWSSLSEPNLWELSWTLGRHDEMLRTFVPFTFLGNHDVTRIASRIDDPRHRPHAVVVLATVGGTPAVYYGDEVGMTGVKEERVGGDDAVRPEFPAVADDLPDDGMLVVHRELLGLRRRQPWLHRARVGVVEVTNETMVYDAFDDERKLRVMLNLGDAALETSWVGEVVAGEAGLAEGRAVVGPHGWAVLVA